MKLFKLNSFNKVILSTVILFFIIELMGQTVYFFVKKKSFYSYHLDKNKTFTFTDFRSGQKFKPNINAHMPGYPDNLSTNQYGFISNNNTQHDLKNLTKKNIFFVGGSTVEGRGASSNKNTIPANLERCLQKIDEDFQVINAGFSGDTAFQEFLRLSTSIVPDYKTYAVISLSGRNDAHNSYILNDTWRENDNLYFKRMNYKINNLKEDCILCAINQKLLRISLLYYSFNYFIERYVQNYQNYSKLDGETKIKNNFLMSDKNISLAAKNFIENLVLTNFFLANKGIEYFSFIQPALDENLKHLTEFEKSKKKIFEMKVNNLYWAQIFDFYKEALKHSKNKNFIYDISDIFKEYNETLYYDSVHYNDRGNEIIAKKICSIFKRKYNF
ncbi:SGNH/GDSL hydrolase family protein [Candidatus Pelagibacter communis]|uniref:SGNH/GDSL hydrolase family protein n=1 Tax=Pelagibacter ubique TaxID=198252 RepID=UPI00094CF14E|nr:SGNH/GDSL hydrolase family protein [Candidatus Pelagibacter ubique]